MPAVLPALLLAATALLASSATAAAGGPPGAAVPGYDDGYGFAEPTAAPAHTRTEHYGGQILLADVAWFAATSLVANLEARDPDGGGDGASFTGLLAMGYFATGPAVHLKHGNRSGASKSLAARALMPVGGALLGMIAMSEECRSEGDDCGYAPIAGMVVGGLGGMVGAMVLDWTVLGKTQIELPGMRRVASLQPRVDLSKTGMSVAIGGAF